MSKVVYTDLFVPTTLMCVYTCINVCLCKLHFSFVSWCVCVLGCDVFLIAEVNSNLVTLVWPGSTMLTIRGTLSNAY